MVVPGGCREGGNGGEPYNNYDSTHVRVHTVIISLCMYDNA